MPKKGKAKVLCEMEFEQLLVAAKIGSYAIRNVALIYCSFGLGLRVKEISSLTISDIADNQYRLLDEICLKRSLISGKHQHQAYFTNKKVYGALTEHLKSITGTGFDKPLFQTNRKKGFDPNALQKWFKSLYDKAGIVGASSQSGRRTFITRLLDHGIGIKAVSQLAGHVSTSTTAIYAENMPDSLKQISNLAVF